MKRFANRTQAEPYPPEMRTQLWPLCCGASIISGFKDAAKFTEAELVAKINEVIEKYVPDHQVYVSETITPRLVFLTLNADQMGSAKLMGAVTAAGFKQFATASPRHSAQGFFVRDKSGSFELV